MSSTPLTKEYSILSLPFFFTGGFLLLCFRFLTSITVFLNISRAFDLILFILGVLFLLIQIYLNCRAQRMYIFYSAIFISTGFLSWFLSGYSEVFSAFLLLTAAVSVKDLRSLFFFWLNFVSLFVLIVILFYLICYYSTLNTSDLFFREFDGLVVRERYSFGFVHPNMFGFLTFAIIIVYFYLIDFNFNFYHLLFASILILTVSYFTYSRTPAFLFFIYISVLVAIRYSRTVLYVFKKISLFLPFLLLLSIFLMSSIFYDPSIGDLFTGRLWLWHTYFVNSGVTLFGKAFQIVSDYSLQGYMATVTTLDSFYAMALFVEGVVPFSLLFYLHFLVVRNDEKGLDTLSLIVFWIYGMTENVIYAIPLCVVFLILSRGILRRVDSKYD